MIRGGRSVQKIIDLKEKRTIRDYSSTRLYRRDHHGRILLRIGGRVGGWRGSESENRVRYVHLLARRGRERAAVPRKQINAPRSNINSIIETKRAGGVAGRSLLARRGCSGGTWLPRRMRVDVSAGLRRMNEGRRVMLPRYCTARHERTSKGRGRGGWLPVPPPLPSDPAPYNRSILCPDGLAKTPLSMLYYVPARDRSSLIHACTYIYDIVHVHATAFSVVVSYRACVSALDDGAIG